MKSLPQIVTFALKAFFNLSIFGLLIALFFNIWVFVSHHYSWTDSVLKYYDGIDFTNIWKNDKLAFNILLLSAIVITILKIILFRSALTLLNKINLNNPFNSDLTWLLKQISILAFVIGFISIFLKLYIEIAVSSDLLLSTQMGESGFLWLSAIVYLVSLLYHKGLFLQSENELTI